MSKTLGTILVCVFVAGASASAQTFRKDDCLRYAREAADWVWDHYDSLAERWRSTMDPQSPFGYQDPGWFLDMAGIYSFLYELEGNAVYAERAKKVLLTYGDFRKYFPAAAAKVRPEYSDGIPALPNMFNCMRYLRAYERLKRGGALTASEQRQIEAIIADAAEFMLRTQEWGPMNRTALRGESLALAARLLPDHPRSRYWQMYCDAMMYDNWGNWEIEDATLYHGVWLYSLVSYAEAIGKLDELFRTPEMYYYAKYFLHLMSPHGMIPDFGDSHFDSSWPRFLAFFEAAASAYRDPGLKWAAETIARRFIRRDVPARSTDLGYILTDCYRWMTDDLQPQPPRELSLEVMEDVQGKKIVFRNGWESGSTYLLLNYKDEGDGGIVFKDYLRDTIPIEEEKVTHGHADENSIVALLAGGSFLLHDGGYRDYMPSGPFGAYRQDYFHNRVCVRQEKIWMGQREGEARLSFRGAVEPQRLLDFLHNSGAYRRVRTQKIDFLTLPEFDYSRTRLIDDKLGYEWDRVLVYVKRPEAFVVFDIVKATVEGYFTAAALWHTRKILASGDHWYDTVYDSLQYHALSTDHHLLIVFPLTHFRIEGVEPERRYYQDELALYQVASQHFELGENVVLATVLIPHPRDQKPEELAKRVRLAEGEPAGRSVGVELLDGPRTILVVAKRDLRSHVVRDYRRPRYTYESGRMRVGAWECDGDLLYAETTPETLRYTAVNVTAVKYGSETLFQQKPSRYGLAFDGSPDSSGVGKVRYWCDTVVRTGAKSKGTRR
ncbi:MAG: hypothetical protein ONB23_07485 [candidate division KSB1 bacterium]|nr:hypothetical protein [candidate division KSB1 bacterium]